jgi:hypothetical protein
MEPTTCKCTDAVCGHPNGEPCFADHMKNDKCQQ